MLTCAPFTPMNSILVHLACFAQAVTGCGIPAPEISKSFTKTQDQILVKVPELFHYAYISQCFEKPSLKSCLASDRNFHSVSSKRPTHCLPVTYKEGSLPFTALASHDGRPRSRPEQFMWD